MRRLDVADVEVVVGEDGAADRADEDGPVLDCEGVDGLGQQLVDDAVAAAGAVVGLVLELGLALVAVVEALGLLVDDGELDMGEYLLL